MRKAVVLLSGGLDSSTTLAIAKQQGYEIHALTLIYGQRHSREIESARKVAGSIGVIEHRVMELPYGLFSGSSLTSGTDVPKNKDISASQGIPSTYVPARNLVFLSMAVGFAEVIDAEAVFIGVTSIDYSGYPDCRPEFLEAFKAAQELATRRGVEGRPIEIISPLIDMSKAEIILKGKESGLDHGLTWSCYQGGEKACGRCDSCQYRLKGFREASLVDPIPYEDC